MNELLEYLKKCVENIGEHLKKLGWREEEIKEGLKQVLFELSSSTLDFQQLMDTIEQIKSQKCLDHGDISQIRADIRQLKLDNIDKIFAMEDSIISRINKITLHNDKRYIKNINGYRQPLQLLEVKHE